MINRYQGNSGKVSRYMEPGEQNRGQGMPYHRGTPPGTKAPARGKEPKGILGSLEGLGKMLPERKIQIYLLSTECIYSASSRIFLEYPYSLSYHAIILTRRSPIIVPPFASNTDVHGSPMKSADTTSSSV